MREAFWGCLDGMNEDGLAVSLTFGGRRAHGRGIAMPMVLRYVLETCRTTREAAAKLLAIPVPMAQNVTVIDRSGDVATVFTGTDRAPAVTSRILCTNHQEAVAWPEMAAASRTLEREAHLAHLVETRGMTLPRLAASFLEQPLYKVCLAGPDLAPELPPLHRRQLHPPLRPRRPPPPRLLRAARRPLPTAAKAPCLFQMDQAGLGSVSGYRANSVAPGHVPEPFRPPPRETIGRRIRTCLSRTPEAAIHERSSVSSRTSGACRPPSTSC
jgi:Acyl-coenzyme A:6-aminopenicillanic acid acyl-transferase